VRVIASSLRKGNIVEVDGKLGVIVSTENIHPGKFMYQDGEGFHFMNMESYDQVALQADIIGDQAVYLHPEMEVTISMHEAVPVSIELPPKTVLEVVETEPTVKGQTASSSYKPAILSNGARTMVPPFVAAGTKIVVMTADGSYVERAKD
jgi:elongation factor P